ncbi:hypothetical protein D3C87_1426470 [compost metagenome]
MVGQLSGYLILYNPDIQAILFYCIVQKNIIQPAVLLDAVFIFFSGVAEFFSFVFEAVSIGKALI